MEEENEKSGKTLKEMIEAFDQEFQSKMNELAEEAKADLSFGKLDRQGTETEIIRNVANLHKWSEKYSRHKQSLKRLHNATNRIYATEFEKCKREMLDIAIKGKSEIDTWVCRQPKYARAKSYLNDMECISEFIENTLDSLKTKGFALKNIIDNRRYFDGN